MVAEAVGVGHSVVMLKALMVLCLGRVLVLIMLLIVVQHIGHSSPGTIQPSIMALLMVLGVHAGKDLQRVTQDQVQRNWAASGADEEHGTGLRGSTISEEVLGSVGREAVKIVGVIGRLVCIDEAEGRWRAEERGR